MVELKEWSIQCPVNLQHHVSKYGREFPRCNDCLMENPLFSTKVPSGSSVKIEPSRTEKQIKNNLQLQDKNATVVSLLNSSPVERTVPAIETGFIRRSKLLTTKEKITSFRNGAISRTKTEISSEFQIELHILIRVVEYDNYGEEQYRAPKQFDSVATYLPQNKFYDTYIEEEFNQYEQSFIMDCLDTLKQEKRQQLLDHTSFRTIRIFIVYPSSARKDIIRWDSKNYSNKTTREILDGLYSYQKGNLETRKKVTICVDRTERDVSDSEDDKDKLKRNRKPLFQLPSRPVEISLKRDQETAEMTPERDRLSRFTPDLSRVDDLSAIRVAQTTQLLQDIIEVTPSVGDTLQETGATEATSVIQEAAVTAVPTATITETEQENSTANMPKSKGRKKQTKSEQHSVQTTRAGRITRQTEKLRP